MDRRNIRPTEANQGQKLINKRSYNLLPKSMAEKNTQRRNLNPPQRSDAVRLKFRNEKPKTIFTCHDKSSEFRIPSPRLKYFPAEEIRRIRPSRSCEFRESNNQNNMQDIKSLSSIDLPEVIGDIKNAPTSHSTIQQKIPTEVSNSTTSECKKFSGFTPAMIRDQEMLVSTMRQQGICSDIMKRQFDALLTEQKRHLAHLEQLQNLQTDSPSESEKTILPRRRRISKIDEDGKPEWMMRITPPWISYATLETNNDISQLQINEMNIQAEQKRQNEPQNMENAGIHPNEYQFRQQEVFNHPHDINMGINSPAVISGGEQKRQSEPQYTRHVDNHPNVFQSQQQEAINPHHNINMQNSIPITDNTPHVDYSQGQLNNHNSTEHSGQDKQFKNQHIHQNIQPHQQSDISQKGPCSLLKLRQYKEVIKRQKQNNGLQDSETIREAMEKFKNPANRPGLEYLEKLNKQDVRVRLNGIQDPEESYRIPQHQHRIEEVKREISANGLENKRNPNNPVPPSMLRFKNFNNEPIPEYPKRRVKHIMMAERENGTVANTASHDNQHYTSESQKPDVTGTLDYTSPFQAQVFNQVEGGKSKNHGRSVSFNMNPSQDQIMRQNVFQPNGEYHQIVEPKVFGGLQYLARKPAYMPNLQNSNHH